MNPFIGDAPQINKQLRTGDERIAEEVKQVQLPIINPKLFLRNQLGSSLKHVML